MMTLEAEYWCNASHIPAMASLTTLLSHATHEKVSTACAKRSRWVVQTMHIYKGSQKPSSLFLSGLSVSGKAAEASWRI